MSEILTLLGQIHSHAPNGTARPSHGSQLCRVCSSPSYTHSAESAERLPQCVISQSQGSKRRERKKEERKKDQRATIHMLPSFS